MKKQTRVNHPREVALPEGNRAVTSPVYRSVKFTFDTIEASRSPEAKQHGFDYTRDSNPTTRQLELLAAELQGRDDAIATATGMAAVWLSLLGNLQAGDRIVMFVESYRPTRVAVRKLLPRFGIDHVMLSVHDHAAIERELVNEATKLLIFESPTNPMLQIPDIAKLCELARRNGVTTVLDNTFAGLHNHTEHDVDFYVHSLTKYGNGHGDVMGGIVIAAAEKLKAVRPVAINMGSTLDPEAAFMILRGLKTYYLRFERHSENALKIAEWLERREEVARVWYPGLASDPGHELAKRQMDDFGGVLSFELRADQAAAWAFIDSLELFTTTASLGSTESLVAPVKLFLGSDLSEAELEQSAITPATVRLAVGIEHVDDLIADLDHAFARLQRTTT